MPKVTRKFRAPLERLRSGLNWVIVRIPFDVQKTWNCGAKVKVRGEINGFPFRTSLFTFREGGHFLLINKKMQRGGHAVVGAMALVSVEPDTEERFVTVPGELKRIFREDRSLAKWFDKLSYSMQKWITDWVSDVKSSEARTRRAEQVAEQLMSTMDAERELPPLIRLAFDRNPTARQGWESMSSTQQRQQLLAVFYYRTPESRARRLDKVLEECERRAERE
jgi:uncharacterized protein YdeI (YjbR/CyaY-like superfamily)